MAIPTNGNRERILHHATQDVRRVLAELFDAAEGRGRNGPVAADTAWEIAEALARGGFVDAAEFVRGNFTKRKHWDLPAPERAPATAPGPEERRTAKVSAEE